MEGGKRVLFVVFTSLIVSCSRPYYLVDGEQQVPCYFIFGDSLVDSGNNNNLATLAKADYEPYGIDFPEGPTGRFCNGRTTADIIGELLGFHDFIPPYSTANGSEILKGVNYASGSAGILDASGKFSGVNIDLKTQLENHQVTISHIADMLGSNDSATEHLSKCLYSFVIGSNDYINNYFLPQYYNTSKLYTIEEYAVFLVNEYHQKILSLYDTGARKVALTGIGPIGCTPAAIASNNNTNGSLCVAEMNNAANYFNNQLQSLVSQLNQNLSDAQFVYLNTYGIVHDCAASSPGFQLQVNACCAVNEYGLCIPGEEPCEFRNSILFWDDFHPTETTNQIGSRLSYLTLQKIL